MDPITAVGLAASIIQLVDFGTRVITRLNDYQSQCKEIPETFSHIHKQLPLLVKILEQTKQEVDADKTDQALRNALSPTVDGCKQQVEQLDQVLLIIVPEPTDSRAMRVKKALLSIKKESDVSKIHSRLTNYVSTLTFYFAWNSSRPQAQQLVQRIVEALAFPSSFITYQKALKQHHGDTGKWLLESNIYQRWKIKPASLIWLHGAPGCGKTVLTSAIVRDLQDEVEKDVAKACAYYFFTFSDKAGQKVINMIKSLICQLVQRCVEIPPSAKKLTYKVPESRLEEALHDILISLPIVYLVIDALDECDEISPDELKDFLSLLVSWKLDHVHILMTSRKERRIDKALNNLVPNSARVYMENSHVDKDIGMYVRVHLETDENFKRWKNDQQIRTEIETALTTGAGGMFRWAACQMEDLSTCLNRAMVLRSLRNLPRTLDETYDRILQSIDEAYGPYALQVLRWLAFARISLTVAQVSHITGFVNDRNPRFDTDEILPDPRDILTVCKSLVTVVEADNVPFEGSVVRLAHFTVQQYLTSDRIKKAGHASFFNLVPQPTEALIARQCIAYLTEFGSKANNPGGARMRASREQYEKFPLAAYALYEWNYHSKCAAPDASVDMAAFNFMREPQAYYNCFLRFGKELPRSRSLKNVLKEASTLGIIGVVRLVMGYIGPKNIPVVGPGDQAPIQQSSSWTEDFRKEIADISPNTVFRAFREAAYHDHRDILDLLIERIDDTKSAQSTILFTSAETGQISLLKWLQARIVHDDTGALINNDALPEASSRGHEQVMEMLLDMGADINAIGTKGTALEAAVSGGQKSAVLFLLDRKVDVNSKGRRGTPLWHAVRAVRPDLLQLLLDQGANSAGGEGEFPAHLAATRSLECLQLLVERNADIHALNADGETMFEVACRYGNLEIARFLITKGAATAAAVNTDDGRYTPLQIAAKHHQHEIINLLIAEGVDLNIARPEGTALHLAITHQENKTDSVAIIFTIKALIRAGADVNLLGPNGTALQLAAKSKAMTASSVVRFLVQNGADINAPGPNGAALQVARAVGNTRIAAALIAQEWRDNGKA